MENVIISWQGILSIFLRKTNKIYIKSSNAFVFTNNKNTTPIKGPDLSGTKMYGWMTNLRHCVIWKLALPNIRGLEKDGG